MDLEKIDKYNDKLMNGLARVLNFGERAIDSGMVKSVASTGVSESEAYRMLLASVMGLDIVDNVEDRELFDKYFPLCVQELKVEDYIGDDYYLNIRFDEMELGRIKYRQNRYAPYELLVYDDMDILFDGRVVPKVGYFKEEFLYPEVTENGRQWMSVTPNEINTMREDIKKAHGKVLVYGLGLGYYAYMVSNLPQVESITIVEINPDVVELFTKVILPQFKHKEKISVVVADAFEYTKNSRDYDFCYVDIWHDVSDGLEMYEKFKALEDKDSKTEYAYWIEKTLKCYI